MFKEIFVYVELMESHLSRANFGFIPAIKDRRFVFIFCECHALKTVG